MPRATAEPIEAAYRVTPAEIEQAVSRTSVQYMGDLRTMLAEIGEVYAGQLAAKDETIATLRDALAGARRRAETAEDELAATRTRYDIARRHEEDTERRLTDVLATRQLPDSPRPAGRRKGGPLARLGRWWRGDGAR